MNHHRDRFLLPSAALVLAAWTFGMAGCATTEVPFAAPRAGVPANTSVPPAGPAPAAVPPSAAQPTAAWGPVGQPAVAAVSHTAPLASATPAPAAVARAHAPGVSSEIGNSQPGAANPAAVTADYTVDAAGGEDTQVAAAGWGRAASRPVGGPGSESDSAGCGCCSKSRYFTSGPWNQTGVDPQEFLCDGGDYRDDAHVRRDDAIVGVDLEDTVVKYTTEAGDIHVQPSNRVCLYAPRFAAVRKVTEAAAGGRAVGAKGYDLPEGPGRIDLNQPSSAVTAQHGPERQVAARTPDAMRDRNRGVPVENVDQPLLAEDTVAVLANLSLMVRGQLTEADKPWLSKGALAAETWTIEENVAVTVNDVKPVEQIRHAAAEGLTVYEFPDAGRLRIAKLADKHNALPGDIVTFLLRVDNVGDSPVHDIVLTDNLTTRLEYVEGSQTCSVGAEFETQQNQGASLRLSWRLTDRLGVGESASIRFRCRVR
ncbi:DUF11 domain-containing protein [Roseimaritima sediminicola]|uniref:DUF11 domain-containing protein n=1 Tax=Roseimaritima sediminicola TaxID=2662066 RepID=UPI0012983FF0|nr:DUF11 domain-containing protein [Roseimaritima sediminicola]